MPQFFRAVKFANRHQILGLEKKVRFRAGDVICEWSFPEDRNISRPIMAKRHVQMMLSKSCYFIVVNALSYT